MFLDDMKVVSFFDHLDDVSSHIIIIIKQHVLNVLVTHQIRF